jgi:uncharacterized protein YjiS (DUF1127 family)
MSVQRQVNPPTRPTVQPGDVWCNIAQATATACAALLHRDQDLAPICLPKILHCLRAGYRLAAERYRQRKMLMQMDDRQLKDMGITAEQAEMEAGKPIWKA